MTHFIAMFDLFPWSGTEHAISLRYLLRKHQRLSQLPIYPSPDELILFSDQVRRGQGSSGAASLVVMLTDSWQDRWERW